MLIVIRDVVAGYSQRKTFITSERKRLEQAYILSGTSFVNYHCRLSQRAWWGVCLVAEIRVFDVVRGSSGREES